VFVSLVVLGVGLAGLFDGIVFHQVLQWHHMLSAWHPPDTIHNLKLNTQADGWFHVAVYATLVAGASMLMSATARLGTRPSRRMMLCGLLIGFGGFNLVEGGCRRPPDPRGASRPGGILRAGLRRWLPDRLDDRARSRVLRVPSHDAVEASFGA